MRLIKSEWLDDWYLLENTITCVEGTSEQWAAIIAAMKQKKDESFRRVSVTYNDVSRTFAFDSPRNSEYTECEIDLIESVKFINQAEALLANASESHP